MAGGIFVYYGGGSTLTEISIGDNIGFSDLQQFFDVRSGVAEQWSGGVTVERHGGFDQLRLVLAGVGQSQRSLRRRFAALEEHLKAGYSIGLAQDVSKAWASFAISGSEPAAGVTTLYCMSNRFQAYTSSTVLPPVGEYVLRSLEDGGWREEVNVTSATGSVLTIDSATLFDHSAAGGATHVRHRFFWPILKLAPGQHTQQLLTEDHGRVWTFNALLREDVDGLQALSAADTDQLNAQGGSGGSGTDQLIMGIKFELGNMDPRVNARGDR